MQITKTMKTRIFQTSLITLLSIISLNIQAVSSETFKNNSIGEISAIESELNDDIALENWMSEVSAFNTCSDLLIEMETGIETWMTTVFTASSLEDKEVSMESWMTNLKEFNNHATAEEFLEKYKDSAKDSGIIGHFGLGFYSAFMVAEKVEIITKSFKDEPAAHWT